MEIRVALERWGTVRAAAKALGITHPTLYKWMHRHHILGRNQKAQGKAA